MGYVVGCPRHQSPGTFVMQSLRVHSRASGGGREASTGGSGAYRRANRWERVFRRMLIADTADERTARPAAARRRGRARCRVRAWAVASGTTARHYRCPNVQSGPTLH